MKNEQYQMIIRVTDLDLKDAFLKKAANLGLTISNDGETQTGIEHIQLGPAISVGTSDKFHVNWARRIDYYADRGIVPVYDIQHDWALIVARLNEYALAIKNGETTEEEPEAEPDYVTDDNTDVFCNSSNEVTIANAVITKEELEALQVVLGMLSEGTITIDTANASVNINDGEDFNETLTSNDVAEMLDLIDNY